MNVGLADALAEPNRRSVSAATLLLDVVLRCAVLAAIVIVAVEVMRVLPQARTLRIERFLASQLINQETLPRERVQDALARFHARRGNAPCAIAGHQNAVVFSAWLAEEALAIGRHAEIDTLRDAASATARESIACDPAQAYAWVSLLRQTVLREGPHPDALPLLRWSYRLAPREGWIMLARARAALPLRSFFTEEDHARLADDLAGMVEAGMIRDAVDLLRRTDAAFQRRVNGLVARFPPATQLAYQRRAYLFVFELEGLSVPPIIGPFR